MEKISPCHPCNDDIVGHYTSVEVLEKILKPDRLTLWATRYGYLNDPLEYEWGKTFLDGKVADLCDGEECDHKTHPYIVSFCGLLDDLNMWRVYGHNGKGVMLMFDRKALTGFCENENIENSKSGIWYHSGYVNYANESNVKEQVEKTLSEYRERESDINKADDMMEAIAFIKRDDYKPEKEFRVTTFTHDGFFFDSEKIVTDIEEAFTDADEIAEGVKFRVAGDMLVPYQEIDFPKECLKGVCLGYDVDIDRIMPALSLLLNQRRYDIKCYCSNIHINSFNK